MLVDIYSNMYMCVAKVDIGNENNVEVEQKGVQVCQYFFVFFPVAPLLSERTTREQII